MFSEVKYGPVVPNSHFELSERIGRPFLTVIKSFCGNNMSISWVISSIVLFSFGFQNEVALSILPSLALYLGKNKIRPKSDLDAMQAR